MTRLERLRRELVALAESLPNAFRPTKCAVCAGGQVAAPHPLAAPLRGIAWSLLPREERYKAPEHGGGPLTSGSVDVESAAQEIDRLISALPSRKHAPDSITYELVWRNLRRIAEELQTAVVQARPGETLDDVLRRERLEIAEETCVTCEGDGLVVNVYGWTAGHFVRCPECRNGRVVAEDAIEVLVAGQVRYAVKRCSG